MGGASEALRRKYHTSQLNELYFQGLKPNLLYDLDGTTELALFMVCEY